MKYRLLLLWLISFQSSAAQPPSKTTPVLDSLIQQFIDQHSVELAPNELAGSYTLAEDFWQETIQLKDNGRFKVTDTGGFSYLTVNRGSWQVKESKLLLSSRKTEEIAYLVKYNGNICLLTSGIIEKWKAIAAELQANGGKLAYDPFMGKISLYKKVTAEDDL